MSTADYAADNDQDCIEICKECLRKVQMCCGDMKDGSEDGIWWDGYCTNCCPKHGDQLYSYMILGIKIKAPVKDALSAAHDLADKLTSVLKIDKSNITVINTIPAPRDKQ